VKLAGGPGGGGYGQGTLWAQAGIPVFGLLAFTQPGEVVRPRYRAEPYVRARLPAHGPVDAQVTGFSRTHVLPHWEHGFGAQVHNVWVPVGWVRRIGRDESIWRDPYDKAEH
jgi:hypothetical protein